MFLAGEYELYLEFIRPKNLTRIKNPNQDLSAITV
jgi:hypothetical protein